MIARTEYGTAEITAAGVVIEADNAQLWAWAHRPNALWPCSALDDFDSILAVFNYGGLVDLVADPDDDSHLTGDELSAWSSDVLREVLPRDHPAWFVTVGQFDTSEEELCS